MREGTVQLKTGSYPIDATTWFDVRMTDMGVAISLCDMDSNIRYTALVDDGKLAFGEVGALIREGADQDGGDPYTAPDWLPAESSEE